jgi:hypothetical protein
LSVVALGDRFNDRLDRKPGKDQHLVHEPILTDPPF